MQGRSILHCLSPVAVVTDTPAPLATPHRKANLPPRGNKFTSYRSHSPRGGVIGDGEPVVVFDDSGGFYSGVWRSILADKDLGTSVGERLLLLVCEILGQLYDLGCGSGRRLTGRVRGHVDRRLLYEPVRLFGLGLGRRFLVQLRTTQELSKALYGKLIFTLYGRSCFILN